MAIQSAFTLTANEIYDSLANMIISQEVFADNLGEHQTLVDKARVDGTLLGDTKLYYSTDVLKSAPWGNDAEAANLLALDRAEDPEVQAIKLDVFRQIRLTTDNYMTKRAFADEGAFSSFNGVMLGWLRETKRVYDGTLYNVFIGTTKAEGAAQSVEVDLSEAEALEGTEKAKMEAMLIAQQMADLFVKMGDYSREFNDYGNLRSYAKEGIKVIWNSKFVNKIRKVDLPTIFHKDGLVEKFEEEILPARYFGTVITSANLNDYVDDGPGSAGKPLNEDLIYTPGVNHANGCLRSMIEVDIIKSGTEVIHLFPGDELPAGIEIAPAGHPGEHENFGMGAGEFYIEQEDVICKVLVKLPPLMSAFEVGTTFFNPRSLTENHYLTFGHNTLAYLRNYPFITVSVKE